MYNICHNIDSEAIGYVSSAENILDAYRTALELGHDSLVARELS